MKNARISALFVLVTLFAVPAYSLETKLSGFYNVRGISDNFSATNNYVGTLTGDSKSESLVD